MSRSRKQVPGFRSEAGERAFWAAPDRDSTHVKLEANKRDVPYQSLIKVWLAEKLEER